MQVSVNDAGNLYFTFKEHNANTVVVHKILNAGELEFLDDDCVGLELFNFEQQINRGKINSIDIRKTEIKDDIFIFHLDVNGQMINGRVSLASLKE